MHDPHFLLRLSVQDKLGLRTLASSNQAKASDHPGGLAVHETLGCLLAAGNVAEVFEWGPYAMKLYRCKAAKPIAFREASIHADVETLGLPVPTVHGVRQACERWGIIFERINQASFADQMQESPTVVPRFLETLARLHNCIHAVPVTHFPSLKVRLSKNIGSAKMLGQRQIQGLLRCLSDMPDGDQLCHGDFHPMNVLGKITRPVVIDWPDATRGSPAADVCRSYLLMSLHAENLAEAYLDAYCSVSGMARQTILDWLSYLAAARLAEDLDNEAERLLQLIRIS